MNHKISTLSLICAAALAASGTTLSAQNLLLHYDFNNINGNTVQDLSGNNRHGTISGNAVGLSPGSGTSGLPGDYSFNNTNSAMSGSGGGVQVSNANFGQLSSFTVTLWYKTTPETQILGATRLFDNGNQLLAVDGTGGNPSGNLTFNADGSMRVRNGTANQTIQQKDEWVFVALTFDATLSGNELKLYVGDSENDLTLIAQSGLSWSNMNWQNGILAFGSNTSSGRALDGWMDNIRFYGQSSGGDSALSIEQLRAIRQQDLTNIPEPATYTILAGVATLGVAFVARRRKNLRG